MCVCVCPVAAWPACVTPSTTSRGFWRRCLCIVSPTGPCLSETYLRWASCIISDLCMWYTVYYYFVPCSNLKYLNHIYVQAYLDILTYYSLSFYSRTVAITGALQLGWRTTLTTLCTPHPVSADHCNSHFNSLVEVDFHLNPCFCDALTDYGQQQVNSGLYIFLVSLRSVYTIFQILNPTIYYVMSMIIFGCLYSNSSAK